MVRSRTGRTVLMAALIGAIAIVDWRVELNVAFGFLYLFPIILAGTLLARWQVVLIALVCSTLADLFDPFPFVLAISLPSDILVFSSLTGVGLFAHAVTVSRRRETEHLHAVEREAAARRVAEEQLEFLVNTSPAAILTTSAEGEILLANAAAHRLFRVPSGALPGRNISRYVAALARVPALTESSHGVQTEVQCRGERETGEGFLADVFFSTYETALGPRLAALVIDVSEALREREVSGLDQLLAGSRILIGAVFHEVRNVCSAMAIAYENIVRSGHVPASKDLEALGALVDTLGQIAATESRARRETSAATAVNLSDVLADLRIVLDPYCEEAGISVKWEIPSGLPPVWADRQRLLQVLLNLVRNSERALEDRDVKRIEVGVLLAGSVVSIRVTDSGPGLRSSEHLFEPFQQGADAVGLGLYLSRALLRSFQGELRHDPAVPGCSFVIELTVVDAVADAHETQASRTDTHGTNPIAVG